MTCHTCSANRVSYLRKAFLWGYGLLFICSLQAAPAPALVPARLDAFYVAPDNPQELCWQVKPPAADTPDALAFVIRNYDGNEVASGTQARAAGELRIQVTLPAGHYTCEFPATEQTFGIVSLPAHDGKPDPFFAIDSAMSWLGSARAPETRDALIKILKRQGIGMSRERVSWGGIEPKPGEWDWECSNRYETLRKRYKEEGIEVQELFHNAPSWAGATGRDGVPYPQDLQAYARSWTTIAARWQQYWGAIEAWNEPDIGFGGELPADHYVPIARALVWALRTSGNTTPIVGGVFARPSAKGAFVQQCGKNGMLQIVDGVSFHSYARADTMERSIQSYREWMDTYGQAGLPLWITECGRPWIRGPGRPDAEQSRDSALDIVMKALEARACGVNRHFPFIYVFYEEKSKNFGMLGRGGTPLRAMGAYASLVNILSGTTYAGDLRLEQEGLVRTRVFRNGDRAIVTLYTAKPNESVTVKLDFPVDRASGLDGRLLTQQEPTEVTIADGLVYLEVPFGRVEEHLNTETVAMSLTAMARQPVPPRESPSPLVLQPLEPKAPGVVPDKDGYRLDMQTAGRLSLGVRIANLATVPQTVTAWVEDPEGMLAAPAARQTVQLGAQTSAELSWILEPTTGASLLYPRRLEIHASSDSGIPIASLHQSYKLTSSELEDYIGQARDAARKLEISDPAKWDRNAVGGAEFTIKNAAPESAWKLDVTFPKDADKWIYPNLKLPEGVRLPDDFVLVVRARCKAKATPRIMLDEEDGSTYLTGSLVPADNEWHVAALTRESFSLLGAFTKDENDRLDAPTVTSIKLGMNSDAVENTLEVSDFFITSATDLQKKR